MISTRGHSIPEVYRSPRISFTMILDLNSSAFLINCSHHSLITWFYLSFRVKYCMFSVTLQFLALFYSYLCVCLWITLGLFLSLCFFVDCPWTLIIHGLFIDRLLPALATCLFLDYVLSHPYCCVCCCCFEPCLSDHALSIKPESGSSTLLSHTSPLQYNIVYYRAGTALQISVFEVLFLH